MTKTATLAELKAKAENTKFVSSRAVDKTGVEVKANSAAEKVTFVFEDGEELVVTSEVLHDPDFNGIQWRR